MQLMRAIPAGRALGERIPVDAGTVQKVSSAQKEPIETKTNPKYRIIGNSKYVTTTQPIAASSIAMQRCHSRSLRRSELAAHKGMTATASIAGKAVTKPMTAKL